MRGTTRTRLVHTRNVLWYRVNKTDLVRLVIVRDPDRLEPDDYFFTTDLSDTAAQVISRYAARWAIEVCFRDVKQDLGGQNPQSWKRKGSERAAALSLWLHATIWTWHIQTHPTGGTWTPRPWYDQSDPELPRRPRRTPPRPVDPTNYHHVPPRTRRHENHQDATGHARLRRIAESKSAKVHTLVLRFIWSSNHDSRRLCDHASSR